MLLAQNTVQPECKAAFQECSLEHVPAETAVAESASSMLVATVVATKAQEPLDSQQAHLAASRSKEI